MKKDTTDKDFSLILSFFSSCYKDTLTNETIVPKYTINDRREKVCGAIKKTMKHEGKNLITKRVGEGK